MRVSRSILLILLSAIILPVCAWAQAPSNQESDCVRTAFKAFHLTTDNRDRQKILYHLIGGIENGTCILGEKQALSFSVQMLHIAETDKDPAVRMTAGAFLRKNPHLGLAESLVGSLGSSVQLPDETRNLFIDILANLRDRRAEPYLLERLKTGDGLFLDSLQALAEMGTTETIAKLEDLAADPQSGIKPDMRAKIPATIADIRLRLQSGFYSPFRLSEDEVSQLKANRFAVTFEQKNEMYEFYDGDFPYVTTDVVFHTAMILVRAALEGLEQQGMRQDLGAFCDGMTAGCLDQATLLTKQPDLRELALTNAAFFAVPARLCFSEADTGVVLTVLPAALQGRVQTELVLIRAQAGVSFSPVLNCDEDFARYRPRGRFAGMGETVENYARAITWLGRGTFPLLDDDATRRALLLVDVLDRTPELGKRWADIDQLLALLFGRPDDGSFDQYQAAAAAAAGSDQPGWVLELLDRPDGLAQFRSLVDLQEQAINTAFIPWPESGDWRNRTSGLRILGQRYSPDSHLFQVLMDDGQWPVSGLHVVAGMMGSSQAAAILSEAGFQPAPAGITLADPPTGLVEQAIHCLQTLFMPATEADDLYRSLAWEDKQINSALGGWAEIRHATSPYVKDASMYVGCSSLTDRIHGYVEPYPEFYRRLRGLAAGLHTILESRDVYSRMAASHTDSALIQEHPEINRRDEKGRRSFNVDDTCIYLDAEHLPKFMGLLDRLEDLSRRELAGQPQTIADGQFLKRIGSTLKNLSLNKANLLIAQEPMSRVIDVATEYQSGTCLEVAVSRPMAIYVVASYEDEQVVCRGAVYNYHEFTWPADNRLSDEQWRALDSRLDIQNRPPWLATRKTFRLPRPVKQEELKILEESWVKPKHSWYKEFRKDPSSWNGGVLLANTTACAADIPQLVVLAEADPGNPVVCLFAQDRLLALDDEPESRAYFARLAESTFNIGKFGSEAAWMNLTALYRHFARQGAQGNRDLENLRIRQLRPLNFLNFNDRYLPQPLDRHLELALIQTRSDHPAQWVWTVK